MMNKMWRDGWAPLLSAAAVVAIDRYANELFGNIGGECDDDGAQRTLTEDCPCERVTLELEDWSTCLMEEDHARSCGRGKQFRRRKCIVTATGQLAPLQWVLHFFLIFSFCVSLSYSSWSSSSSSSSSTSSLVHGLSLAQLFRLLSPLIFRVRQSWSRVKMQSCKLSSSILGIYSK